MTLAKPLLESTFLFAHPDPRTYTSELGISLSPFSHHRQISRLTEWTWTSVDCTAIKRSVSIHVQKPLSCAGPEHTNPNFSCAAPITDDREITITTKLADAFVDAAPVPLAITVKV
jgi:hypothetical protein